MAAKYITIYHRRAQTLPNLRSGQKFGIRPARRFFPQTARLYHLHLHAQTLEQLAMRGRGGGSRNRLPNWMPHPSAALYP